MVMDFSYCGGLGISAGELIGVLMQHIPFRVGTTCKIAKEMTRLAQAIRRGEISPSVLLMGYIRPR